jgi:hypothetical protein
MHLDIICMGNNNTEKEDKIIINISKVTIIGKEGLHQPKRKMRQNYNKNILLNFI